MTCCKIVTRGDEPARGSHEVGGPGPHDDGDEDEEEGGGGERND
jgi:hypothetical protein